MNAPKTTHLPVTLTMRWHGMVTTEQGFSTMREARRAILDFMKVEGLHRQGDSLTGRLIDDRHLDRDQEPDVVATYTIEVDPNYHTDCPRCMALAKGDR